MKAMKEAQGLHFGWIDLDGEHFELHGEGDCFATLRFPGQEVAQARTAEGEWDLSGFAPLVIRQAGNATDFGVFEPGFMGHGHLSFRDGSDFMWKPTDFQGSTWAFHDVNGRVIVLFPSRKHRPGSRMDTQPVELRSSALVVPKVPLLVAFGQYLKQRHLRGVGRSEHAADLVAI